MRRSPRNTTNSMASFTPRTFPFGASSGLRARLITSRLQLVARHGEPAPTRPRAGSRIQEPRAIHQVSQSRRVPSVTPLDPPTPPLRRKVDARDVAAVCLAGCLSGEAARSLLRDDTWEGLRYRL